MHRRLLSAVLTSLPALLLGSLPFLSFEKGEYYTRPWQIAAVVFFVASFLFGLSILGSSERMNSIHLLQFAHGFSLTRPSPGCWLSRFSSD